MTTLIAVLISLLGYGTPADFSNFTETELQYEISMLETSQAATDGGGTARDWDTDQ